MVSVIIANYNYAEFISDAIRSALAQDWPFKEIIVIDDGSTDQSRAKINLFGDRIKSVFTKNRGQREANNSGFALSSGDIIVFLDADDLLLPGFLSSVVSVWTEKVSKVQVLMQRADRDGTPSGNVIPKINGTLDPAHIRSWSLDSIEYPGPPGSANAWSRKFLNQIFPLDKDCDSFTDSTCIAMAPYFGDIITLPEVFVLYRMHGNNNSNMTAEDSACSREVSRALKRFEAVQKACIMQKQTPPDINALYRGSHLLQLRVASMRLTPALHPLPEDSLGKALKDAVTLLFRNHFESFTFRILIIGWSLLTAIVPLKAARFLIRKRFNINLPVRKQRYIPEPPIAQPATR
ncbi:glycosyltransferase family 2 protein [Acetobacter oeni]|nr:glycosyltransferase [Acetobacter oeni]